AAVVSKSKSGECGAVLLRRTTTIAGSPELNVTIELWNRVAKIVKVGEQSQSPESAIPSEFGGAFGTIFDISLVCVCGSPRMTLIARVLRLSHVLNHVQHVAKRTEHSGPFTLSAHE